MAENFNLIFGSNAPDSTTWSDADYQTGWSTVGSTPPTAEQFDFLQNRADLKAKELKDTIDPLVNRAAEEGRQPSTAYALGDTATADGIPTAWFLECTTAGTTDSSTITVPSPLSEGGTISDGTVVWTVRKTNSISNTLKMGVFNHKETFTSSSSFTAPVTGTYRITLQGGGGGGAGAGYPSGSNVNTGGGGSQGGHGVVYENLTAGTSYSYTIGAGGSGGAIQGNGTAGGDTTITINGNIYEAKGGGRGMSIGECEIGGAFIINNVTVSRGATGQTGSSTPTNASTGGGAGGGAGGGGRVTQTGIAGGGGAGGDHEYNNTNYAGGAGGDGYITFEYCDL